jgi:acyl-CoA synthetase (NDP forming)
VATEAAVDGAARVDAALRLLWDAGSVAVVGATDRPGALGRLPVQFLQRYGYTGRVVPVNRRGGTVCGLPAATSLAEAVSAGGPIELALLMLPAAAVTRAVRECGEAGVRTAVVMSSGFAETGAGGEALQRDLVAAAREQGVRVVGPNCIGSVGFANGQVTAFSPLFSAPQLPQVPGRIGFATQSGALGYGLVSLALERGLGLAAAVNTGNEADVTALEVLEAMAADPGIDALLGYVESLADGPALRRLAGCGKPLALLKAGTSQAGSRAAASHTGALATSDRVVDAALAQLGIARAHDVDELLDLGEAFASLSAAAAPRIPAGPRVAVVTTSGGSGILAADAIEDAGLQLATLDAATTAALEEIVPAFGSTANPVDVTATVMSDSTLFDRALEVIADDSGVDALVACFCVLVGDQVLGIVESLRKVAERTGKPVFVARTGAEFLAPEAGAAMREAGLPCYPTPGRAVRALAGLARATGPRPATIPASTKPIVGEAPPSDEVGLKALLRAHGVPVPAGRLAESLDDARRAVEEVGGRAVVKAVVPGLLHKTEAGGVVLGVTEQTVDAAYEQAAGLGGEVLVEEMVTAEHSAEVLVGVTPSPLGRVLTLATGGVLTELMDDAVFRLLPAGSAELATMVDDLRGAPLLKGFRGSPPLDTDALTRCLQAVADIVAGWPDDVELDLNPVLVLPTGVRVLDAAVAVPNLPNLPNPAEQES